MPAFLRPSLLKIFVSIFLFVFFSWLWRTVIVFIVSDTFPYGVPFPFFLAWGPCPPGESCSEFNGWNLLLDLVFWYAAAAWLVSRFKKA